MEIVDSWLTGNAGRWEVLVLVWLGAALDGFLPPVPSESLVVGLAAVAATDGGGPSWLLLAAVAATGAVAGDNVGYAVGRRAGPAAAATLGRRRAAALAWATDQLARRGTVLVLAARYVPFGRTAVNVAAGVTGFPHRRFFLLTLASGTSWAAYCVGFGTLVGLGLPGQPVLAAVVGMALAALAGLVVDRLLAARRSGPGADPVPAPAAPR